MQQNSKETEENQNEPQNEIENQTRILQPSNPDLALALEPFGYRKDPKTGQRSTTFKALPAILKNFQDSRRTIYFPDSVIEALRDCTEINSDPNQSIGDEQLGLLFETALSNCSNLPPPTQSTSPTTSPNRIRTAESPASNRSDHPEVFSNSSPPSPSLDSNLRDQEYHQDQLNSLNQPDNSFDSNNEDDSFNSSSFNHSSKESIDPNSLSSPPGPIGPSNPSLGSLNASVRSERHRSLPLDYPGNHRKPRPPNRRKRGSMVADFHQNPIPLNPSSLSQSTNTNNSSSPHIPQELDSHSNIHQSSHHLTSPVLSPSPQLHSSSNDLATQTSAALLTPNNLSSHILKNRQLGLYDSSDDHYNFHPESSPPGSDGSNSNNIISRLRSEVSARPDSKVYTRVFESSSIEEFDDRARDEDDVLLQSTREDYPILIRKCEAYRSKNKELENQISKLEKLHEDEIVKLTDQIDEMSQELSSCKKIEKDLSNVTSKLRFQLSNSDDQMTRMNKESNILQENYSKMKLKWDEAVSESEKLRVELKLRNEELRLAHHSIESHASDIKKCESDQELREEHIKKLKLELEELQTTRSILEEQKHANLELKTTIDKLKFELDEQRMRNAGSSVGGSRPTSIVGSVNQRLGEELKKVIASGHYDQNDDDDDSGSETTGEDDPEDLARIVKGYADPSLGSDHAEIFDEVRIRYSRRSTFNAVKKSMGNQEDTRLRAELMELRDVGTSTNDLLNLESKNIQTDPIPEPPPVYRPKTQELEVQTEMTSLEDEERSLLLKLVTGIDPTVLKSAIDHIHHQQMMAKNPTEPLDPTPIQAIIPEPTALTSPSSSRSSNSSSCGETDSGMDSEVSSLDQYMDDRNVTQRSSSPFLSSYLSSWGLSGIQPISSALSDRPTFSPYWVLNSLPTLRLIGKNKNHKAESSHKSKSRRRDLQKKTDRNPSNNHAGSEEGKFQKNLRICISATIFIAIGCLIKYPLLNMISADHYNPATTDLISYKCKSCGLIQSPSLEIPYSIGHFPSLYSSSSHPVTFVISHNTSTNTTGNIHNSFIHLKKAGLHRLADFNSLGHGNEGFFVHLVPVWLKELGTNMIWKAVKGNQQNPT